MTAPASGPQTRVSLATDLARLGVARGETVLVHTSLSALGWVCGGATTVVHALLDVLGPTGNLVVTAQSPDNRDPSTWTDNPVPESWWQTIRDHLPGFDAALTPSTAVGVVPERVRTWPGAVRSNHPQTSFAAIGPRAAELMEHHLLESPLGDESPLARLEKADANILLLGVGFNRCTAFHLAEYRLPSPPRRIAACAVADGAGRRWIEYPTVALDDGDFGRLGAAFEGTSGQVTVGRVGAAECRFLPMRPAVEFATSWLTLNRN
ncbi:AAC(3) family N-acetyltransferase [Polymorphospora sp. NPDC050346]|uniref:aminoglycoside N(3)-acetyltransferase n=1 Tax=Polymorphospora sp. NPDC050346 TaxID=3155780 RepID=UPI0033E684EF